MIEVQNVYCKAKNNPARHITINNGEENIKEITIKTQKEFKELVEEEKVKIIGGVYDINTGTITIIE